MLLDPATPLPLGPTLRQAFRASPYPTPQTPALDPALDSVIFMMIRKGTGSLTSLNIGEVDIDIVISVTSALLVVEAQGVKKLVHDGPMSCAPATYGESLFSSCTSNTRVTSVNRRSLNESIITT